MARGKRGPRPDMKVIAESGITVIEESFLDEVGPAGENIEEIVGKENIVDVDEPEVTPQPAERQGYKYTDVGCTFQTGYLSEMEEHNTGTGHGGYKTETLDPLSATQPGELFSEPGIVHRNVEVPIDPEVLNEKRVKLAELYQEALEVKANKKSADAAFNAQLTGIDEDMQSIARVLRTPFTYAKVETEWRIIDGENARGLYRLDTGEMLENAALTEEDRAEELRRAEAANQPATEPVAETAEV